MGWYWEPRSCLWNQDWGSPLYKISRAEAPLRTSGRSDMVSRTVMVRNGPELNLQQHGKPLTTPGTEAATVPAPSREDNLAQKSKVQGHE